MVWSSWMSDGRELRSIIRQEPHPSSHEGGVQTGNLLLADVSSPLQPAALFDPGSSRPGTPHRPATTLIHTLHLEVRLRLHLSNVDIG